MTSETTATSQKTNQRRKKAAVLALAGVVGIGAAATMANWTDEESAGADLQAGQFDLEIATTAAVEKPKDEDEWVTNMKEVDFAALEIKEGPWGPGDSETSYIHVRLAPDTTHAAELSVSRDPKATAKWWEIDGPDSETRTLLPPSEEEDGVVTFPVTVAMSKDASSEAQTKKDAVVWSFFAEQQPN